MGKPQIQDLLEDIEFIRWVKHPDADTNLYWQHWMDANPDRIGDVKLAKEILLNLTFPAKSPSEEVKKEVLNRLLQESAAFSTGEQNRNSYTTQFNWGNFSQASKIAAILVIGFLLIVLVQKINRFSGNNEGQSTSQWVTKTTNFGEKRSFRLPDGTMVWLNAGSTLEYPGKFDSTVRWVTLKGEAFFEVAKNPDKPFKVQSVDLITTALGTSFNINAIDKNKLKVSLLTGKVKVDVESGEMEHFLIPGQELSYNSENKRGSIGPFDALLVQGWKNGVLAFSQNTFSQVSGKLERWYGVSIITKGKASNAWRFTGKFENQTLETVLISMSNIEAFDYKINDKEVIISF